MTKTFGYSQKGHGEGLEAKGYLTYSIKNRNYNCKIEYYRSRVRNENYVRASGTRRQLTLPIIRNEKNQNKLSARFRVF